jgi:chromosome segregation ATPase
MPEENEKVEDFISLWRKKMENGNNKPSVIRETLEKIKEVEKENEDLRNKIKQNIELISRSEQAIKKAIEENERLKKELEKKPLKTDINIDKIKQENESYKEKIKNLEEKLLEKEEDIQAREYELSELKMKSQSIPLESETKINTELENELNITKNLVKDLQSELSKKKSIITEIENNLKASDFKVKELTEENEALNRQLVEKLKKLTIDYVVPVETPKEMPSKPEPIETSAISLETLCQDLQSDLNRAKRMIQKLTEEKNELQKAIKLGGIQLEPEAIKEIKKENEALKNEISKLQTALKTKTEETSSTILKEESEIKIKELTEKLKEKENVIDGLRKAKTAKTQITSDQMSDLIEDLQNRINKYKIELEEKNKIIDELKSS